MELQKMAKRRYDKTEEGQLDNSGEKSKKRFRGVGGGHKTKVPEIRVALFEWFVDVQTSSTA